MVSCDQSTAFFAVDLLIEYVSFHCVQIPMVFSLQLFTVYTTERKVLNIFGNLISLTNTLIFRLQIEEEFWFEPFGVNLLNTSW